MTLRIDTPGIVIHKTIGGRIEIAEDVARQFECGRIEFVGCQFTAKWDDTTCRFCLRSRRVSDTRFWSDVRSTGV